MPTLESAAMRVIVRESARLLGEAAESDVVIVGAGPAGLTAAYYLAKAGFRVTVVERRLSFGGGIGGGASLLPIVTARSEARSVLDELGVRYSVDGETGLLYMTPADLIAGLASAALTAGARIILGLSVEDVLYETSDAGPRVRGVMAKWSAIDLAGLHVDPIFLEARATVDATGHDAEVLRMAERLPGAGFRVAGQGAGWASEAERLVVEKTGRVIPGLYAAGMSVAALHGLPRMGPVFSSMLLSGRRVAEVIEEDLRGG